jgi:hypothetical protein
MTVGALRSTLKRWFEYYHGYDPLVSWWVSEPYKEADQALEAYANFVREKLVGIKVDDAKTITAIRWGGRPFSGIECGDDSLHARGIDCPCEE